MNSKRKLGSQQTIWMTTSSTASRSSEMMAAHFIISSSAVAVSDTSATDAWKDMLRLTRSAVREEGGRGSLEGASWLRSVYLFFTSTLMSRLSSWTMHSMPVDCRRSLKRPLQ